MLTEQQINNIHKLSVEDSLQLLRELIERLGLVSQSRYKKIMSYENSRQQLRIDMISGKIPNITIGKTRYPLINVEITKEKNFK